MKASSWGATSSRCAPNVHRRGGQSFAGPNVHMRVIRMGKKAAAGVQFVQTQCIYNMDKMREFMKIAGDGV